MDNKSTASRGKIVVRLDNLNVSNDEARMKISANLVPFQTLCCAGINNPYYIISRAREAKNPDEFVRVYRSPIMYNNTTPIWNPNKIKLTQLCNGEYSLPIKFSFYSHDEGGTDQLYGEATTTVNKIQNDSKKLSLMKKD